MLLSLAGLFGVTNAALAGHPDVDAVTINTVPVSGCGAQTLTLSGTAAYSEPTQHLVVALDGVILFDNHSEPEVWSTGPVAASTGTHAVTATIYDKIEDGGHEIVRAQDSETFAVPSCTGPAAPSAGSAGASVTSQDCCPGPDIVVSTAKKPVGRVKGAAQVKKLPLKLKWMNETFRKVHGRTPTFREWEYWSNRLLTDKPQYPALYGAIQWHELRGHTTDR